MIPPFNVKDDASISLTDTTTSKCIFAVTPSSMMLHQSKLNSGTIPFLSISSNSRHLCMFDAQCLWGWKRSIVRWSSQHCSLAVEALFIDAWNIVHWIMKYASVYWCVKWQGHPAVSSLCTHAFVCSLPNNMGGCGEFVGITLVAIIRRKNVRMLLAMERGTW